MPGNHLVGKTHKKRKLEQFDNFQNFKHWSKTDGQETWNYQSISFISFFMTNTFNKENRDALDNESSMSEKIT